MAHLRERGWGEGARGKMKKNGIFFSIRSLSGSDLGGELEVGKDGKRRRLSH
jgi:hypothetical protein